MKVFVSYSHKQGTWVREQLVPVLRAGGVEVLIDRDRFQAGMGIVGQMDATQDEADKQILVLSPDYLASNMCKHEMRRAVLLDPNFKKKIVIPLMRVKCTLPASLKKPNPLYVNLRNDKKSDQWDLLLKSFKTDLGCHVPDWLKARDDIVRALQRNRSVNLITGEGTAWKALLAHVKQEWINELGIVDLQRPAAASRRGLIRTLLAAIGAATQVPPEPEDLVTLDDTLSRRAISHVALIHFHYVQSRSHYGPDLFHALRYMAMEARKLVLLIQSQGKAYAELLPLDHPLSALDMDTIELNARP